MALRIGAVVAVVDRGRVLLTQREDFWVWCLPGGGIEEGESPAQAAVREAREETGLEVEVSHLVGTHAAVVAGGRRVPARLRGACHGRDAAAGPVRGGGRALLRPGRAARATVLAPPLPHQGSTRGRGWRCVAVHGRRRTTVLLACRALRSAGPVPAAQTRVLHPAPRHVGPGARGSGGFRNHQFGRAASVNEAATVIGQEPCADQDAATLVSWVTSQELMVLWAGPSAFAFLVTADQVARHRAASHDPVPRLLPYKAVERATGEMVGYLELAAIQRQTRSANVGRVIVHLARRREGIGAQMVLQLLAITFGELGLHRGTLSVFTHNAGAIACYRAVGFTEEGRARDYLRVDSGFWDLTSMAILEHEWRAIQS
jgi:RimJ/RimL family protein N-acetyltransferase